MGGGRNSKVFQKNDISIDEYYNIMIIFKIPTV